MDKEKEIEEMEDIISCCWNTISAAKKLYNAGYRKVPDGAVVLLIGENNQALDEKTIEYFVKHNEQIRKETAREILDLIAKIMNEECGGEPPCNFNCNDEYMFENCNEFCREYCNTLDNEKNYERCWIEFLKSKMKKYGVEGKR